MVCQPNGKMNCLDFSFLVFPERRNSLRNELVTGTSTIFILSYPLKLTTHQQHGRPHALLLTVEVTFTVAKQNVRETTKTTICVLIDLIQTLLRDQVGPQMSCIPWLVGTTTNPQWLL
jgi:hypothetical protein